MPSKTNQVWNLRNSLWSLFFMENLKVKGRSLFENYPTAHVSFPWNLLVRISREFSDCLVAERWKVNGKNRPRNASDLPSVWHVEGSGWKRKCSFWGLLVHRRRGVESRGAWVIKDITQCSADAVPINRLSRTSGVHCVLFVIGLGRRCYANQQKPSLNKSLHKCYPSFRYGKLVRIVFSASILERSIVLWILVGFATSREDFGFWIAGNCGSMLRLVFDLMCTQLTSRLIYCCLYRSELTKSLLIYSKWPL